MAKHIPRCEAATILETLLEELRSQQSWCPLCGGEKVHHNSDCLLKGYWFDNGLDDTEDD